MTINADKLRKLHEAATPGELRDGGRYFAETCDDLTRCGHGDTGEYQHRPDGELVEYLWNHRADILALMESEARLREALVHHGRHLANCSAKSTVTAPGTACDCGLYRALEGRKVVMQTTEEALQKLGDRVADMFEQMIKGNWTDDHGHDVLMNKAMADLAATLNEVMQFRADVLGYSPVEIGHD